MYAISDDMWNKEKEVISSVWSVTLLQKILWFPKEYRNSNHIHKLETMVTELKKRGWQKIEVINLKPSCHAPALKTDYKALGLYLMVRNLV